MCVVGMWDVLEARFFFSGENIIWTKKYHFAKMFTANLVRSYSEVPTSRCLYLFVVVLSGFLRTFHHSAATPLVCVRSSGISAVGVGLHGRGVPASDGPSCGTGLFSRSTSRSAPPFFRQSPSSSAIAPAVTDPVSLGVFSGLVTLLDAAVQACTKRHISAL